MAGSNGAYIDYGAFEKPEGDEELELKLAAAREAYSNALNDILDRVTDELKDHPVCQFIAQDFAMFAMFVATVKMVELAGEPPWRKRYLSAFQYLVKRTEREVPEKLIELARHIAGGRAGEDGEEGNA